jgi:hypothetical protein
VAAGPPPGADVGDAGRDDVQAGQEAGDLGAGAGLHEDGGADVGGAGGFLGAGVDVVGGDVADGQETAGGDAVSDGLDDLAGPVVIGQEVGDRYEKHGHGPGQVDHVAELGPGEQVAGPAQVSPDGGQAGGAGEDGAGVAATTSS